MAKHANFTKKKLHTRKEQHPVRYLQQKTSFWIAALSLIAFVAGNMMGQVGVRAFWASVVGGYDDSLIVYTGVVAPIELVPDYERWAKYGGSSEQHTFKQVPQSFLRPLPHYDAQLQRRGYNQSSPYDVYSIAHMGSYKTGAEGSGDHVGVDIRIPEGTPIRSIANGVVTQVRDSSGFGQVIVLRHPHMPDPARPGDTTVLHSVYAHLSAQFVSEGDVVAKGQNIGLSGSTGNVTGPHLHFQVDRDEAEWHPYWPFTGDEMRAAGLSFAEAVNRGLYQSRGYQYTVHPMLYVQANYPAVEKGPVVALSDTEGKIDVAPQSIVKKVLTVAERRAQRIAKMLARREQRLQRRLANQRLLVRTLPAPSITPTVVATEEVATASDTAALTPAPQGVESVAFQHDGSFDGGIEQIRVALLDAQGHTIRFPKLNYDLILSTAYGYAEFDPPTLSVLDFKGGVALVEMRPAGRRTIVIQALPHGELSPPMRYEREEGGI